jgi:thiamine-monophosphate kinase
MLSEFDLIKRYFKRPTSKYPYVSLGIGDDCALLSTQPDCRLAVSTDMLVEGRHFFKDAEPTSLGHKCLAVNLSDLAAMGAKPIAFTLALSLPAVDEKWLAAFAQGLFAIADTYQCPLIGGDTTQGPLNICITIFGELPLDTALQRNAAIVGDDIWVSGSLGDARLALAFYRQEQLNGNVMTLDSDQLSHAAQRLHKPTPRIELGIALRGIAHAAIDVSDGLSGDLGHILSASQCGASVNVDALPTGLVLSSQPLQLQRDWLLAGGDDYELCFTAPFKNRDAVLAAAATASTPVTRIGQIDADPGLRFFDKSGAPLTLSPASFDHFTSL